MQITPVVTSPQELNLNSLWRPLFILFFFQSDHFLSDEILISPLRNDQKYFLSKRSRTAARAARQALFVLMIYRPQSPSLAQREAFSHHTATWLCRSAVIQHLSQVTNTHL